jgi:hypothetical protein
MGAGFYALSSHVYQPSKLCMRRNVTQRHRTLQLANCTLVPPGCTKHHRLVKQRHSIVAAVVRGGRKDCKAEEAHARLLPRDAVVVAAVVVDGGWREGSSEHTARNDKRLQANNQVLQV